MSHDTELTSQAFSVLHELALTGPVPQTATRPATVDALAAAGLVTVDADRVLLTSRGRSVHALAARVADDDPARAVLDREHAAFVPLNAAVLQVCHDWQVRWNAPNEHTDPRYDERVVNRLGSIHTRACGLLRRLAGALPRFAGYEEQLEQAWQSVDRGNREWFTSPMRDSYHTVWMRLHRDLVMAMGAEPIDASMER